MACEVTRDDDGVTYTVPAAAVVVDPKRQVRRGLPQVQVWWSRPLTSPDETLIIRQEYDDRQTADVIELTFGQVYDLIEVLNQAVETP